MARAAVLGRVTWRIGRVTEIRDETPTARTLAMDVPDWPGHLAGQHVDIRLTAPDGYSATRSYSIASAADSTQVEVTVDRLGAGEVSPYLTDVVTVGDQLELRGPVGGWFVWQPSQIEPVNLIAGGSGVVPLMAMVRTHAASGSSAPSRLLYSVREPGAVFYRDELHARARAGLDVTFAYTRSAPEGSTRAAGRVDERLLREAMWGSQVAPTSYVCGPTGFVETVAALLVEAGHEPDRIRTERFGPSGGNR
jgi:ferredoxin-NADP reductase